MPETHLIYIPLPKEGPGILRQTQGELVDELVYKVLPAEDYNPAEEVWQFPPGTTVRCVIARRSGKELIVAVEEFSEKGTGKKKGK